MRYFIVALLLCSCGDPLVDKTDNSVTNITCEIETTIYTPEEYLSVVNEIDDEADVEETLEGNIVVSVEVCTGIANSTDDDVVEPGVVYDSGI